MMKLQTTASGLSVAKRIEGLAQCLSLPKKVRKVVMGFVAWENSRHLATLPMVSPPNDVWETSAEIPYWWRVTTLIWVALLIGWSKSSDVHSRGNHLGRVAKCRMFSQVMGFEKKNTVNSMRVNEAKRRTNLKKVCCKISKNMPHFPLHVTLDAQAWWKVNQTISWKKDELDLHVYYLRKQLAEFLKDIGAVNITIIVEVKLHYQIRNTE